MLHLPDFHRRWLAYAVAVVATVAAAASHHALFPLLGYSAPTVFILSVLLSAYVGGAGPGLVAVVLGAVLSAYLFLTPLFSMAVERPVDQIRLILFLLVGLGITLICEALHQARRRSARRSEALRQSEERFRATYEHAPIGIKQIGPDGRLIEANAKLSQILGYDRTELLGMDFEHITHPDDRAREAELLRQLQAGETSSYSIEKRYLRKDGQPIWVRVTSTLVRDPGNDRPHRIATVEDVTEHKRSERALRESEERLRQVTEAINGVFWMAEPGAKRALYVSRSYETIWGRRPEQLYADFRDWQHAIHPEDRERVAEVFNRVLDRGSYDEEYRVVRPDGSVVWIHDRGHPVVGGDGAPTRVVGFAEDVTERRRAQEERRRTTRSLELLSDSATRLLLDDEPEKTIPSLLEALANHLGLELYINYLVKDGGGLRLHAYRGVEPELARRIKDLAVGEAVCGVVASTGDRYVGENVRGQNDPRLALVQSLGINAYACHPLLANGRVVGTVSFGSRTRTGFDTEELELMRTLCDQMAMALERKRLTEEIKRRAAELAQANAAKDRFLATLSHELRTPLNPVLMTVSSLQQDPRLPEDVREDLELALRNVELEARLIDDLLDLTRISRGKVELRHEPVDVHALIRQAIEACCRSDLNLKRQDMRVEASATQHLAWGDPARLQQVFWNLVKNAIKFTPAEGVITLRTFNLRPGYVTVEVKDTGIGIEPELLPRLFDAFEQGDPAITRKFGGLGLGLAISKAVVDLHGGAIEAESAGKDHGATFRVELPLYVPGAGDESAVGGNGAARAPRPVRNGRLSILLVEDHEPTLSVMRRVLTRMGHDVHGAPDVATAKAVARGNRFDLVISDLGLPDGTGYELMRHLSEHHALHGIALSGYGMEEDLARSHAAGFDEHLVKPVNVQQLEAAVLRVAGATAGAGTAVTGSETLST